MTTGKGSIRPIFWVGLAALIGVMPIAARAAEEADCTAPAAPLPASLAGWNDRAPLAGAADTSALAHAVLAEGRAADVALKPSADVRFAVAPERPAPEDSFGGLLRVSVKTAGHYRIALGAGAWVDVARDGKLVASTAHGHGPACSGVRKMVDFTLAPGDYVVQLSGAKTASIAVLFVPLH